MRIRATGRACRTGFAALACLLLPIAPAQAAAVLEVAPVVHELPPGQTMSSMTITNRGAAPSWIQARAFEWRQDEALEQLQPTAEMVASPPLFQLEPGESR